MTGQNEPSRIVYSRRTPSGSQSVYTRRFGPTWSMASIACRKAGDASSNFNAIFMVQELSFDTSLSILELTPNRSFGVISNARHKSEIRVDATALGNALRVSFQQIQKYENGT